MFIVQGVLGHLTDTFSLLIACTQEAQLRPHATPPLVSDVGFVKIRSRSR